MKIYHGACDGSAGCAVDAAHFFAANDENQVIHLYRNDNSPGQPLAAIDFSDALDAGPGAECDLEGAAAIGDVVYWIGSHGRDGDGVWRPARHRFFATILSGAGAEARLTWRGRYYARLLEDLCDPACWRTRDEKRTRKTIEAIAAAAGLGEPRRRKLAPKRKGFNIEGLAATPDGALLIGLRNPVLKGRAIVVPLENPSALVSESVSQSVSKGGARARFGPPARLDLDGRGVRSLSYLPAIGAYAVIAGPAGGEDGPYHLYRWSGAAEAPPTIEDALDEFDGFAPEALITYGDSDRVQILGDGGRVRRGGVACKERPTAEQFFTDRWRYLQ